MTDGAHTEAEAGSVLVVGSVAADLTVFTRRRPAPGETVLGEDFALVLGGKGANQAVAAARAGGRAIMVACVGEDPFADLVLTGLTDAGVVVDHVQQVAGSTGIAHIRVDESGENDIVVVPLANGMLDEERVDTALDAVLDSARVLLTQLEIPLASSIHAMRRCRDAGLTVVLDPAPAAPLDDLVWPLVDIVTPNETEAGILTGIPVTDADSAVAAGRYFTDRGAGAALITLGGAGAVLVTADEEMRFDPIRVEAVDTTAAGDAFAGCLGASLAQGLDLPAAVRRSIAAGALAVTRRGASSSLPTAAEIDALLASRPPREA